MFITTLLTGGCSETPAQAPETPVARGVALTPPASFAPCGARVGGFCDATSLWGASLTVPPNAGSGYTNGGVSVADFDGDGRLDLFVCVYGDAPVTLFLRRDRGYENATDRWGLSPLRRQLTAAVGDLDGDGDPDAVVGSEEPGLLHMLRNDGDRFTDVGTLGSVVRTLVVIQEDLDRDGRLDLLVGSYGHDPACASEKTGECPGEVLAWRQVEPWRFEAMHVAAGARQVQAMRVLDIDGDGRDEVLVGADNGMVAGGNQVLDVVADPRGFALRERPAAGFEHAMLAMGIAALDVDSDGADEVVVTNYARNVMVTRRRGALVDVASTLGGDAYGFEIGDRPTVPDYNPDFGWMSYFARFIRAFVDDRATAHPSTKWTPVVIDYDDDGHDDLFIPSGQVGLNVLPELPDQAAVMLRGDGQRLTDVTRALGLLHRHDARAAAAADLDGDGDLDLAMFHTASNLRGGGLRLLRNDSATGRALTVIARGREGNRDGVGARVTIRVGARTRQRRVDGNLSIYAHVPAAARFGLGTASVVDEVSVRFPSGAVRRLAAVPPGVVVIEE